MGALQLHNTEGINSIGRSDDRLETEPLICPVCGASFNPRTVKQDLCKLKCYVEMKKRQGLHRRGCDKLIPLF